MKRIFVLFLPLLFSISVNAQRASVINDIARYNEVTYATGDTIKLGNGSQQDKSFAYVSLGTIQSAAADLDKSYTKKQAIIEKVFVQRKVVYITAALIDKANIGEPAKILIDLEAAADEKEIVK